LSLRAAMLWASASACWNLVVSLSNRIGYPFLKGRSGRHLNTW